MQPSDFPVITITHGASGFFAVHYWWNPEDGGFPEPYNTGFGRYPMTPEGELQAIQEARHWAEDEEIRLDPNVLQRETELKNQLKLERMKLVAQDRDGPFDMVSGQTDPTEDTH